LQCVAVCTSRWRIHVCDMTRSYIWSYVLQCVAVCCRVLQSVAVCCSVLQCVRPDDLFMSGTWHVYIHHHMWYVLHGIRIVCNTYCMQYVLYAIRIVCNTYCMQYVLYAIRIVCNTYCMQYVLHGHVHQYHHMTYHSYILHWGMSHMNESCGRTQACHIWMSHVDVLRHVTYEWVMSHSISSPDISFIHITRIVHMYDCTLQAANSNAPHHTATHCNTRQRTSAHCNTLQHTPHCSTL